MVLRICWGVGILLAGVLAIVVELEVIDAWTTTNAAGETETRLAARLAGNIGAVFALLTAAWSPIKGGINLTTQERQLAAKDQELASKQTELDRVRIVDKLNDHIHWLLAHLVRLDDGPPWDGMAVKLYYVDEQATPPQLTVVAVSRHHLRESSGVVWTRGKGCVGLAWEHGKIFTVDLDDCRHQGALKNPSSWNRASGDIQQGLTWKEADLVDHQPYGAVGAYPVKNDGQVLGVVAVDVPSGYHDFLRSEHVAADTVGMHIQLLRSELVSLVANLQT